MNHSFATATENVENLPTHTEDEDYFYGYYDETEENKTLNNTFLGNRTAPNYYDQPYGDYYGDYYRYGNAYGGIYKDIFYYKGFDFERPVYLYAWIILIVVTTLSNILVMLVLTRRNMRNATNVILIAIAIVDSLTGLVTIPVTIYAYTHYEMGDLALTKSWCEAFMLVKYFVSRSFHTMSIWLTVLLGLQRLISVSFPFRAQRVFSIQNTVVIMAIVAGVSPVLHIYHAFNRKASEHGGLCEWTAETPCRETCAYLWLVIILMHFLPCMLLVIFTVLMVFLMIKTSRRMQDSHMIANQDNMNRRNVESRRISCIVIAVMIVFLIPEIPYGTFLLITASLKHAHEHLLDLKTNRSIICAYEILMVLGFHANFWIYSIMNRRFRHGLQRTFDPLIALVNSIFGKVGIRHQMARLRSDSTSFSGRSEGNSHTGHSRLSHVNSATSYLSQNAKGLLKPTESVNSTAVELKTYHFKVEETDSCTGLIGTKASQ